MLQSIYERFERLHDALLINGVENLAHPIGPFRDDSVSGEFLNDFVVWIKADTALVRSDSHQDAFKTGISADIGSQVTDIGVCFFKKLRMCCCKVRHLDRLIFRDVHLLGKNLRKSVDEERLPGSLLMECFNDFVCEHLSDFVCILHQQIAHLFACEIGQVKLILDIEG